MNNKYDRMVARSIRKYEQKMWQITAASIACFILFIRFYILLNAPDLPPPGHQTWPGNVVTMTSSTIQKNTEIISTPATGKHTTSSHSKHHTKKQKQVMQVKKQSLILQTNAISQDHRTTRITENTTTSISRRNAVNNKTEGGRTITEETPTVKDATNCEKLDEDHDVGSEQRKSTATAPYVCKKGGRSEFCDLEGDIRIDPDSPTIYYVVSSSTSSATQTSLTLSAGGNSTSSNNATPSLTIKPYARNDDRFAMGSVREWSVKVVPETYQDLPFCNEIHDAPGVVFSFGGYAGNHFHSFADVLIPLFATSHPFNREVELLVTDNQLWLLQKFRAIMQGLSSYDVIDIDREQQGGKSHCFSRLILGLKGRQTIDFGINSSESTYTMRDFKQFLRSTYFLNKTTAIKLRNRKSAPQLLIISRETNRLLTNTDEVTWMAAKLGYNVTVAGFDMNVTRSAEIMNPFDVVVGVHGAGLANMVFLPDNAVVVQVVPYATDWFAQKYEPSKEMSVRYVEYKIKKEESSLMEKYVPDDVVFTNPTSFEWDVFKPIFFDGQDVKVDLKRFKLTLLKALALLWDRGKVEKCKKRSKSKI